MEHCPLLNEKISDDRCHDIVVNATSEQLQTCVECPRGQAHGVTAGVRQLLTDVPLEPEVEVGVQGPETEPTEPVPEPREDVPSTPWERVQELTRVRSQGRVAEEVGVSEQGLYAAFRKLAKGLPYQGQMIKLVCKHYGLDLDYVLHGHQASNGADTKPQPKPEVEPEAQAAVDGKTHEITLTAPPRRMTITITLDLS